MIAQFYKRNYMLTYVKYMAHTTLGVKISAPKDYLKSILEGLAVIYKICKMAEFLGSCSNSRT